MHEIYFKILIAGSCNIFGGVLGWPSLNVPSPGGEGLGWEIHEDRFYLSSLGVTVPRLDRYVASAGEFRYVDDVTGESVNLINEESARSLREAM